MATIMNTRLPARSGFAMRSSIQKVCIVMGFLFLFVGVTGIVLPGLFGMHLSMANNLIHIAIGALSLTYGYSENSKKAYSFAIAFGVLFGVFAVAGFVVGQPGYPGVGYMAADQNLLRVIPNILEFGTIDHSVHLLISAILLFSAYIFKREHVNADRAIVDVQRRREVQQDELGEGTVTSYETFDSSTTPTDEHRHP